MRCGERRKSDWRSRRNSTVEPAYKYVSEFSVSGEERGGCFGISCVSESEDLVTE